MIGDVSTAASSDSEVDVLASMLAMSRLLCEAQHPEQVIPSVAENIGTMLDADGVAIYLNLGNDQVIRVSGAYGELDRPIDGPEDSLSSWQSRDRDTLGTATTFLPGALPVASQVEERVSGASLFPISARGSALGFMAVRFGSRGHRPPVDDSRLCQTIANQIATALLSAKPPHSNEVVASPAVATALIREVLGGGGLPALVDALEGLLGNPVTVADAMFHHLAYSPRQDKADRHRLESLARGGTVREALDDPRIRRQFQVAAQQRAPTLLGTFPQHGWTQRRMQSSIFIGPDLVGRVTVAETEKPFSESDICIMREATTAFALELMKRRIVLETELRLQVDFLQQLLSEPINDVASVLDRAAYLGIDLLRPHDLIVAEIDEPDRLALDLESSDRVQARRRIFEILRFAAVAHAPGSVAVAHLDHVVVLVPSSRNGSAGTRRLAEAVRQAPSRISSSVTVSIGLGASCRSLEDFPRSYARAKRALETARGLGRRNTVTSLDDLGVCGMLFRREDPTELSDFADRIIGRLVEYDRAHGARLIETLGVYFDEGSNQRRTAERLNIHVNTLAGRLQRIETVSGLNLDDGPTRLNLQLALQVLHSCETVDNP